VRRALADGNRRHGSARRCTDDDRLEGLGTPADEQVDEQRERRRVSEELAGLPARQATVIELSYVLGETLQTIAEKLGISIARAHQIRNAALEKLRHACLEGAAGESKIAA
jgi:RNA polymerase sigma factor (sigma-70 family)